MLKIIYGAKGAGKTSELIEEVNQTASQCDGEVVYLTDKEGYTFLIKSNVRLVNTSEYEIATPIGLSGFVRGMIATNADIMHIYIDGIQRMTNTSLEELKPLFLSLASIGAKHNVEIVLTYSKENLPDYLQPYAYKSMH